MNKDDIKYTSIHYQDYLQLDKVLGAQKLRSAESGEPAHDEMLFIIIHQVYELWFKQIIHEVDAVMSDFDSKKVDERNIGISVARLDRVVEIQEVLIKQITVLETLTSLDFLDFRSYLFPASGFQSVQFRQLEILMGLPRDSRINYLTKEYDTVFDENTRNKISRWENGPTLFSLIEDWLERSPFINHPTFNFLEEYQKSVGKMFEREEAAIKATSILSDENKKARIENLKNTEEYFTKVLNKEEHNKSIEEGRMRLSYEATVSALMINLYREEPILWMPYNLIAKLVEIDELFTTWRYRHAQMVLRMLGNKMGTGGSSGHKYLKKTAEEHHIFRDFHNIATLLVPRSELPKLPNQLKKELGFYFTTMPQES